MAGELLTRETWLLKNGFGVGGKPQDPFSRSTFSAEDDPRRKDCFVEIPYYEKVKGTLETREPVLIYAPRGGGKSALRCQIASELDHALRKKGGHILAVQYDQFDCLLRKAKNDPSRVTLRMHVEHIVGLVVARLFYLSKETLIDLRVLSKDQKYLLKWYILNFANDLHYQEINQYLGKLFGFRYYLTPENLVKMLIDVAEMLVAGRKLEGMREVLTTSPVREAKLAAMPDRKLLMDLIDICRTIGIDGVYVLVDNLDKASPVGGEDFEAAFQLVQSLCGTSALHTIHNVPNLVFRIFVPEEIYSLASAKRVLRPELGEHHIRWKEDSPSEGSLLARVLKERLEVYSKYYHHSLKSLVETDTDLALQIDRVFVEEARTPRELLVLGDEMLAHHFHDSKTEPFLTRADWEAVCQKLREYRRQTQASPAISREAACEELREELDWACKVLADYELQTEQKEYTGPTIPDDLIKNLALQRECVARLEKKWRQLCNEGGGKK